MIDLSQGISKVLAGLIRSIDSIRQVPRRVHERSIPSARRTHGDIPPSQSPGAATRPLPSTATPTARPGSTPAPGGHQGQGDQTLREYLQDKPQRSGSLAINANTTMDALVEEYFARIERLVRAGNRSPDTLKLYRGHWPDHLAPAVGALAIAEADVYRLDSLLIELRERHSIAIEEGQLDEHLTWPHGGPFQLDHPRRREVGAKHRAVSDSEQRDYAVPPSLPARRPSARSDGDALYAPTVILRFTWMDQIPPPYRGRILVMSPPHTVVGDGRMVMSKHGGNNFRSKHTRRLVSVIRAAGGTVTVTARGHLWVRGPTGIALLGSDPPRHGRGRANLVSTVRRHAGIAVK